MLRASDTPLQGSAAPEGRLLRFEAGSGTLGQRVYVTLRQAILNLDFGPGEILRKSEICAALGVSRAPVSEAVARLSAEGLVTVVPQAGSFVARFSMHEIREGAFLREAIEVAAAERVAETVTAEQLQDLQRSLHLQSALVEAGDIAGFYRLDAGMHELILSFTGFRRPAQVAESAWLHVNRARQLLLPMPGRVQSTLEEHRAIVAAIAARDPEAARGAVRRHLRQLLRHLEPLELQRPELFDSA